MDELGENYKNPQWEEQVIRPRFELKPPKYKAIALALQQSPHFKLSWDSWFIKNTSTFTMETSCSSETFVSTHRIAQFHKPENHKSEHFLSRNLNKSQNKSNLYIPPL
jgi:hypothetical protein